LIVTAAVVWGTKTQQIPSLTPDFWTDPWTEDVISMNSVLLELFTWNVPIIGPTPFRSDLTRSLFISYPLEILNQTNDIRVMPHSNGVGATLVALKQAPVRAGTLPNGLG
jgi:hypothetical protein